MFENFGLLPVTLNEEGIRFIVCMTICIGPVFGLYYGDGQRYISFFIFHSDILFVMWMFVQIHFVINNTMVAYHFQCDTYLLIIF